MKAFAILRGLAAGALAACLALPFAAVAQTPTAIGAKPSMNTLTGAEVLVGEQVVSGSPKTSKTTIAAIEAFTVNHADNVEKIQDVAGAMIVPGTCMSATYNDTAGTLTLTGTCSGGGSSVSTNLSSISGKWYAPRRTAAGTLVVAPDLFTAVPIFFSADTSVASLGIRVTALVASTNGVACVYANTSGRPGALEVGGAAAFSTAAVANVEVAFTSATTITAGWHWFATHFNGAPTVSATGVTDQYFGSVIGATSMVDALNASNQINGVTGTATYTGACPSTFGTSVDRTLATPLLAYKVQ